MRSPEIVGASEDRSSQRSPDNQSSQRSPDNQKQRELQENRELREEVMYLRKMIISQKNNEVSILWNSLSVVIFNTISTQMFLLLIIFDRNDYLLKLTFFKFLLHFNSKGRDQIPRISVILFVDNSVPGPISCQNRPIKSISESKQYLRRSNSITVYIWSQIAKMHLYFIIF